MVIFFFRFKLIKLSEIEFNFQYKEYKKHEDEKEYIVRDTCAQKYNLSASLFKLKKINSEEFMISQKLDLVQINTLEGEYLLSISYNLKKRENENMKKILYLFRWFLKKKKN